MKLTIAVLSASAAIGGVASAQQGAGPAVTVQSLGASAPTAATVASRYCKPVE